MIKKISKVIALVLTFCFIVGNIGFFLVPVNAATEIKSGITNTLLMKRPTLQLSHAIAVWKRM